MSSPSNLYAEKAFAEHPIALWALDDPCDYISYVSEENRKFYDSTNQWEYDPVLTANQKNAYSGNLPYEFPFTESAGTEVIVPSGTPVYHINSIFSFDVSAKDFSVGFYISPGLEILNLTITAEADGGYSSTPETFFSIPKDAQTHVMSTFTTDTNLTNVKIKITINGNMSSSDYSVYLNGFSAGTRSEEFSATSLGQSSITLPSSIALSSRQCLPVTAYASESNFGYYLVESNVLLARNSTIPMVFGASNSTIIKKSSTAGQPSLILPGMGFMNEIGRSTTLTLEMWLKINAANASERIVGPISSTDGLYIDGPFLVLKVGENICSHFVGEWFRPMLIDITIGAYSSSLIVNGEVVASMSISKEDIVFASPTDINGKDQDWIGFYASDNVPSIEIDCVAIYPYEVSETLAKRKFVFGQGASYPEETNAAYSGESVYIDYAFADYAKTYEYPGIANWKQGIADNLNVSPQRITSPSYVLPNLSSSDASLNMSILATDLGVVNQGINLVPNATWQAANSYLYFDSLNILTSPVYSIQGFATVPVSDTSTNEQILLKIVNRSNNSYFKITRTGDTSIDYWYKESGSDIVGINNGGSLEKGTPFSFGISIPKLTQSWPKLKEFFSNRNDLSVFILGDYSGLDSSLSTSFTGFVSGFGFSTQKNYSEFSALIPSNGTFPEDLNQSTQDINGMSYELKLSFIATVPKLEVKTKSSWTAHVPLSYFGKYITDSNGISKNSLDFIQINLDYPQTRLTSTSEIDTSQNLTRTYVTFQKVSDGANKSLSEFFDIPENTSDHKLLITPSASGMGWYVTARYEVIDGTILNLPLFPPDTDFTDYAICLHVEMIAPASINKKLSNRFIKLSSQSLSDNSSTAVTPINNIKTRFGKSLYPYVENVESGFPNNISYKGSAQQNPFRIFRSSGTHLYLTNNSGISPAFNSVENDDKGLFFRINRNSSGQTNISSIQMAMLWNNKAFPTDLTKLFEIISGEGTFRFYIKSIDSENKRAQITAKFYSSGVESDTHVPSFYWNGKKVSKATLTFGEWGMLGIVFIPYLTFNNSVGYFKITSPIVLNNISTYQLDTTIQAQQIVYRSWANVDDEDWDFWNTDYTWGQVLYQSADANPSIDPGEIYKIFIGTNKAIADSSSDSGVIRFNSYQYATYQNIQWDSYIASIL